MGERRTSYFGVKRPRDLVQDNAGRWAWKAPRSFVSSWLMVVAAESLYAAWRLTEGRDDAECRRIHAAAFRAVRAVAKGEPSDG